MIGSQGPASSSDREVVLVLVRGANEAQITIDLLASAGLRGVACSNLDELCDRLGSGAAVALLAEEMLSRAGLERLRDWSAQQAPWSDFPLIVFGRSEGVPRQRAADLATLGNVTFLDRPVRAWTMLAAVKSAIRSRRRQYEARRAIESRDAFLAMLGHELRNPLGAIAFAISLLDKNAENDACAKERAIIERQSRHLSRLVDDLLDVARITHGKVELKREKLDLVEVARSAFETLESRAREHRLSYDFHCNEESLFIDGDKQRLEQVLTNLLTNAIKYTPRGGAVTLEVRPDAEMITVSVSDTGVGLAPNQRERVFEPFAQVDASLDRAQGGLGLGLALVRSIIQLHGGSVEAHSEGLDKGSTFIVQLRRHADDVGSAPRASPSASDGVRKRVLVIEDNEDIRELFAELLRTAGHDVACAEDGPGGLHEVLTSVPDIAFVDVGLPGFDGLELARRARASGSNVYLIALTGYGQAEDKRRTRDAGFNDHLVKPALDTDVEKAILRANRADAGVSA